MPLIAANHYIRAGAAGTATGADWTNACPDFTGACSVSSLVRGDTYYVAGGTYSGRNFNTPANGSAFITIKKATVADHGTNTGWADVYASSQAVFSSQVEFETSYWIFDGMTGGGPGNWNAGFGFRITESRDSNAVILIGYKNAISNVTVRHADLQGKGSVSTAGGYYSNDGVAIYNSSSDITISRAWLHGIGRCPVFITGAQNAIFEYLYVSSYFGSSSVHSEVMSSGQAYMGDVTWRYSLITDIKSTGGLMWDNSTNPNAHMYVYGNVFYKPVGASWDQANGVIGGWTGNNGEQFRNVHVYNNTFVNIDQETLSTFPNVYSGNVAYNNLWYNCQSPNFAKFGTHDYNHFINSGGSHSEAHGSTATSNPFAAITNLDFNLTADTVTGLPLPSPFNIDPEGVTRGVSGVWTRGAFQYSEGSASAPLPPTGLVTTVR